ncbi:MAG: 50S ribosomal protein L5 [Patescibacteria group bacterium]
MSEIKKEYIEKVRPKLQKDLKIKNLMAAPKLTKIVVNMGLGEAVKDKAIIAEFESQLIAIVGQKPRKNRARKSVAGFNLREGQVIGLSVTLRGQRMYDFFEKFIRIVLPRMRDFRGVPLKNFDGQGNYSIGISEQIVFSEVDYSKVKKVKGLEITFVTTAKKDKNAKKLLELLGMPFEKEKK